MTELVKSGLPSPQVSLPCKDCWPLVTALPFPFVGGAGDFCDAHAVIGGVAAGVAAENEVVAGFERIPFDSLPAELAGGAPLGSPGDGLSVFTGNVEQDSRMRVAEEEFHDLTLDGDFLVGVSGREGVVGGDAVDEKERGDNQHRPERKCSRPRHMSMIPDWLLFLSKASASAEAVRKIISGPFLSAAEGSKLT